VDAVGRTKVGVLVHIRTSIVRCSLPISPILIMISFSLVNSFFRCDSLLLPRSFEMNTNGNEWGK